MTVHASTSPSPSFCVSLCNVPPTVGKIVGYAIALFSLGIVVYGAILASTALSSTSIACLCTGSALSLAGLTFAVYHSPKKEKQDMFLTSHIDSNRSSRQWEMAKASYKSSSEASSRISKSFDSESSPLKGRVSKTKKKSEKEPASSSSHPVRDLTKSLATVEEATGRQFSKEFLPNYDWVSRKDMLLSLASRDRIDLRKVKYGVIFSEEEIEAIPHRDNYTKDDIIYPWNYWGDLDKLSIKEIMFRFNYVAVGDCLGYPMTEEEIRNITPLEAKSILIDLQMRARFAHPTQARLDAEEYDNACHCILC